MSLILMVSLLGLLQAAPAQEDGAPREPGRVRTQVNVRIIERFQDHWAHPHYEQPYPDVFDEDRGTTRTRVTSQTGCEWDPLPPATPPDKKLPVSLRGVISTRNVGTRTYLSERTRRDPSATYPFGDVTKPVMYETEDSSAGDAAESANPPLYGPEVDFEAKRDVTEWRPVRWLPQATSLNVYGRALFGETELSGEDFRMSLYSVGLRLTVPLLAARSFLLSSYVSSGPTFLDTNVGNASGVEGGVGIQAQQRIVGNLSLLAALEANVWAFEDAWGWGPALHLGFDLPW